MRKLKKLLTIAMSVGMIATSTIATMPANTVSATYDDLDVNMDGYVGTADLTIVTKYLNGIYSVSNYNQLDVNKSLTVDAADSECLTACLLGNTYEACYYSRANAKDNNNATNPEVDFPTVSGFTPNSATTSTASREYMIYSYLDHEDYGTYYLTPTITELGSETNSRSVIGSDDRYVADGNENSGIVRLSIGGTGFVVSDHVIATAAHCVYDRKTFTWVDDLSITTYDNNGNILSNSTLTPVEAHIPKEYYRTSLLGDINYREYDYALITVAEDLSDRVHFSLGTSYNVNSSLSSNVPIYVTGCPSDVHGTSNSNNTLYSAEGNILGYQDNNDPFDYEDSILTYDVDMSGGDSGGPVYTITQNTINGTPSYIYTALAINAYEVGIYNFGAAMTNYHNQFYNNNPYMDYTLPTE